MTLTYDARNRKAIEELAPNTKKVAKQWYEYCVKNHIDILITDTRRTLAEQKDNVARGVSHTMKSYHLVGQALDFVPVINGKGRWDKYNDLPIKRIIKEAQRLGFTWGGDWDSDGSSRDETFIDSPHLQYEYKGYGTDKVASKATVKKVTASTVTSTDVVPYPGSLIREGSKGKDVERIQRALKVEVTGTFDAKTKEAVIAYQKKKGLDADGIVGQGTWSMMF